jgi:methyl-accepting chemotaxis protein
MIVAMRSSFERMNASAARIDRAAAELVDTMSLQRVGAGANLATVSATMATLTEIVASSAEAERRGRAAMDLAQRAVATSEQLAAAGQRTLADAVTELERAAPHVQAMVSRVRELADGASALGSVVDTVSAFADRFHDLSMQVSQQAVEIVGAPPSAVEATLQGVVSAARGHAREAQRAAAGVRRTVGLVLQETRRTATGAEEATRAVEATIARVRDGAAALESRGTGPRDGARASRQIAELIQEQLDQMEEVLRGVENVRRATTQFNSAADQTLTTAKALTRVSAEMKELLSSYRVS